MIQLTLKMIQSLAGSDQKFKSGFKIHQKNTILSIEAISQNGLSIHLKDLSDQEQTVILYFYKDTGTFNHAQCSCGAFQPCKHTLAALLYILYKKETLSDALMASQSHKMFEAFDQLLFPTPTLVHQEMIGLSVLIAPEVTSNTVLSSHIFLSVGQKKKYAIKNIENFLTSVAQKEVYTLSKFLDYQPNTHYFNEEDQQILDLLQDYLQTKKILSQHNPSHWLTPLHANRISLPEPYLKRLLSYLKSTPYDLRYKRIPSHQFGISQDLDISFYMAQQQNLYTLSVNTYDTFFPLTQDYTYIFYNQQIYTLTPTQQKAFALFYAYLKEKYMDIAMDQLDDFINRMLPILERIGHVTLASSIQKSLVTYPLICQIHIDQISTGIQLKVAFHYGPYRIGIYPAYKEVSTQQILMRQLEKEHTILNLLQSHAHNFSEDGRLYYHKDADLFFFIDSLLPKLMPLCDIYYSKDFKQTYLQPKKHLETRIHYFPKLNLLSLDFELEGVEKEDLFQLLQSVKEKQTYHRLSSGGFFPISQQLIQQVSQLDQRFQLNLNLTDQPLIETPTYNGFYLHQLLTMRISYNKAFQSLLTALNAPATEAPTPPEHLINILRDYQKSGFHWLTSLARHGLNGILADDMGLGKTLQAIATLLVSSSSKPSLVVAPTSLIYNWEEEFHKFAPQQKVRIVFGSKKNRLTAIAAIEPNEVVITSYGSLKRDLPFYTHTFNYCIIDEAQHIKNPKSQNALTIKRIQSNHRLALTGTPIQNTLTELWSIFDFILPNFLGSHSNFVRTYEKPIVRDEDANALKQLNQLTQPFILRRLKKDVLAELPEKIETKVSVTLNKYQKSLYVAYIEQAKKDLHTANALNKGQRSMKLLSILTRLRQICCHPSMFMENYTHTSSKMSLLFELIHENLEGGHRILIFSQFTSMLALIRQALEKEHLPYFYLDGRTPATDRQKMVHDFNLGDQDLFLISLKAGGTGLNLTGADVVIHYDPWWNPAVENQATDRAHRIGQKKCVQVYRLITAKTIEEKIYHLQQHKTNLIDRVIQPGQTFIHQLSSSELEMLLNEDYNLS